MKRYIILCLASISLLSSCDYAQDVRNPLTFWRDKPSLNVTVNGVTAIININKTGVGYSEFCSCGACWDTTPNPSLQSSFQKEWTYDNVKYKYFVILDSLQENTTYYLRPYISNPGSFVYGDEITFTTESEYVDLGLSVKWGTSNVGISYEYPTGQYFAWGEIESKEKYNSNTYQWYFYYFRNSGYSKYVTDSKYAFSTVDNKTVLDLEDDAAYVLSRHRAHIPTKEQWEELISSCDWEWEELNGMHGFRVTSKTNKNSIFLPALGHMSYDDLEYSNLCYYWSKSLDTTDNSGAWCLYTIYGSKEHKYETNTFSRSYGLPIRAVYE